MPKMVTRAHANILSDFKGCVWITIYVFSSDRLLHLRSYFSQELPGISMILVGRERNMQIAWLYRISSDRYSPQSIQYQVSIFAHY